MGRELRRVPLSFNWPLREVWEGYVNPYPGARCPACDGTGYGPGAKELADSFYGGWEHDLTQDEVDALVENNRLFDLTHRWTGEAWTPLDPPVRPTPADVSAWSRRGFGHDAINRGILIRARVERLGLAPRLCPRCEGGGHVWLPGMKARHDAWKPADPPTGPGYQAWETTSEGSPITPVFRTLRKLCAWAAEHASPFGNERMDADAWHALLSGETVGYTDPETGIVFL
jgi:hypothetical protein